MIITHHYIKHVLYVTSNRQLFSCNKPSDLNERVTVFLQVTMKKLNVAQYKFAKCCADVKKIDAAGLIESIPACYQKLPLHLCLALVGLQ